MNAGFFLPLLVAVTVARPGLTQGPRPRRLALGAGALLALTGAVSDADAWWRGFPTADGGDYRKLAAFLADHGLTYGFGSYAGSNATTFTLGHPRPGDDAPPS